MTFAELIRERYSVRKFKPAKIEKEKVASILEAAKVAPTAANRQPQKIYVVTEGEKMEALKKVCKFTFDAPIIFITGYDTDRDWKNNLMPGYSSGETDAAIVTTHMMLQAWELGLGSCWVGWFNSDEIKEALEIPGNVVIASILPVGYPADESSPSPMHTTYREDDDMVTEL